MEKEQYLNDLKDIKEIMERSSRFISLSGFAGVFAGIFALAASYLAYITVYSDQNYLAYRKTYITIDTISTLLLIAGLTLVLSIGSGIFFTTQRAKKMNQPVWNHQTKRLLINLAIPLATGGIFSLILLLKGFIGLVAPITLLFYGLALVNASKYTLSEIRSLGLLEIILGLTSTYFIGYGLLFWASRVWHTSYCIWHINALEIRKVKDILKDLNKAFENKIRLGVMSALIVNDYLDFNALKSLLDVTDGNLSSHLKSLENSEFISCEKRIS